MRSFHAAVITALFLGGLVLVSSATAQQEHAGDHPAATAGSRALPPLPAKLPGWMDNTERNHLFYKRGRYNFDVRNLPKLDRDLNAVAVGHAMAYEDLVTGRAAELETKTFARIDRVLKNPPRFMPDEAAISPTFGRKYGVLEQVFDWTHVLHAQTIDVLASKELTNQQKDREIEKLWKFYFDSVPYAVTPLPMNMGFLDSQPYSGAFRQRYPKVNGLFWGYHWLQGITYDMLHRLPPEQQRSSYEVVGEQYHRTELYRTDRPFMPMFAETSPHFAARFPEVANAFDNLHMLHDMVNDILASDWMTGRQKEEQIKRAIWLVSADAHRGEKWSAVSGQWSVVGQPPSGDPLPTPNPPASPHPEDARPEHPTPGLHDHRFFLGMPGMGMMKGMTPELMWMQGQGWMSMADCHHCSMPLWEGKDEWRNPTVSAEGWTMRVRCALCARDMSAETKGRAILRIPTEDPDRLLLVLSDEKGNLKSSNPEAVFLEKEGSHTGCDGWSRAFTSRAAFGAYVKANPEYAGAKLLTFDQWAQREGAKPDTYVKPKGPVENPYAAASGEGPK
jgi:hypothetical protein